MQTKEKSTSIFLIHGANSSKYSWNWLSEQLPVKFLTWSLNDEPKDVLNSFEKQITSPSIIIGHSMGGIFAWHLARRIGPKLAQSGITISTPWGGIKNIEYADAFGTAHWANVCSRSSDWTKLCRKEVPPTDWTNVVTTRGFDIWNSILGPNDGVISVSSQKELALPHQSISLEYSHNEILQTPDLLAVIKNKL
jgi:pimeloyl-ACP methyl ester carboxylesterase